MKICDLQTSVGRLQRESKRLREKWEVTKTHWQDQACKDFEEKYLQPLVPTLQLTLSSVYELSEVIEEAEQECDDR